MIRPLAFVAPVAVLAACATPAAAHARLKGSEPAAGATVQAPKTITLTFGEGIVPRLSGIALADAAGHAVSLGKPDAGPQATILVVPVTAALGPGVYVVRWHAVATDTHRTQGTFRFTVAP